MQPDLLLGQQLRLLHLHVEPVEHVVPVAPHVRVVAGQRHQGERDDVALHHLHVAVNVDVLAGQAAQVRQNKPVTRRILVIFWVIPFYSN